MERRKRQRRLHHRQRLTTALLTKISLAAISIVVVASAATFLTTYENAKQRVIEVLQQDLSPTLTRNQQLFNRIEQHGEILTRQFISRYQLLHDKPSSVEKFNNWYQQTSDGVFRLKPEFDQGVEVNGHYFQHLSAFLGPRDEPISQELKGRTIAAQMTLDALAPAWQNEVANTHFSMPENILIVYSQSHPWGLLADKGLIITDYSVVKSTLLSENPDREPNWTGLYHDISAGLWTITYQRPVDLNGRHLVNASFDVNLDQLLSDLTEKKRPNSEHMVLNQQGALIAASNLSTSDMTDHNTLVPENYDEPLYQAVSQIIGEGKLTQTPRVLESSLPEHVAIINKIKGPNWWYVTLYPQSEIKKQALVLPVKLVAAGIGLVLLILLIVYWLINQEVSKPLRVVAKVASMMGQRNYQDVLDNQPANIKAKGEVRQALTAFKHMAGRFIAAQQELERQVETRTAELAAANRQLDALAHLDGLTGLFNRRAFDRDLLAATKESRGDYLMLSDIDEFKPYNDNYGHDAGDQALKKIAACLQQKTPLKVYRYGGEELAIILPAASAAELEQQLNALREAVAQLGIEHQYKQAANSVLTISIGAAPIRPGEAPAEAIRRADKQLYKAKHKGRNAVVFEF
ncbi:diguanylate cyclase [Idiomarina seosinensis]|uniref:diguanylate cyclase n=1 Tax=Idiomarina seosinensis TaxID=281739 RepID=UPI00384F1D6A